ncbi:MAG: diaminopimelate epimerase [Actinobacteria bacterium]|nr:MAG: diaminopimelate epimerase [Actinomycetota bacterium]
MRFEKWQALGNDYLIFEAQELAFALAPGHVRRLCDVHRGVGADGVLVLHRPEEPDSVARLQIFNSDGSEAELSGNGARQAILYLHRHGWTQEDSFAIQTPAGEVRARITAPDTCRMDMGQAAVSSPDYPSGAQDGRGRLRAGGRQWAFQHVSIGNPQCAIGVSGPSELEALELSGIGPEIERHELFPNRTNVSWFCELAPGEIRVRIFERGVGETLSSGTGASGAAVAYVLDGGRSPVVVQLPGGQLTVEVGSDLRVHLTGWARPVYAGMLDAEFVEDLHET